MNDINDKKHWYDGWFYDKLIAPNQDKLFNQIKNIIDKESNVLDDGCGTGRLAFQLSNHCKSITGIDLSSKNITVAKANQNNGSYNNIEFIHSSAEDLQKMNENKFDYAVITYVIHEMPESERVTVIKNMKAVADKIIIGDYITPTPNTLWGKINIVVEYLAGSDHYNNFKNYVKNGGLKYLVQKAELSIVQEIKNSPQTSHLVVLK